MFGTGIAYTHFRVQTCHMRKTSDIIWQDAQHQVLFEILDLIKEPGSDRQAICKLEDYTEYHFALEEKYMAELDYPGLEDHVRAHDLFRRRRVVHVQILRALDEGYAWPRFKAQIIEVGTELKRRDDGYLYAKAILGRTARRLMEGYVLVPEKYFSSA